MKNGDTKSFKNTVKEVKYLFEHNEKRTFLKKHFSGVLKMY